MPMHEIVYYLSDKFSKPLLDKLGVGIPPEAFTLLWVCIILANVVALFQTMLSMAVDDKPSSSSKVQESSSKKKDD